MTGLPGAKTPHETYLYYWGHELQAIRAGRWKLHFPHAYRSLTGRAGQDGKPSGYSERKTDFALYDLEADIGESHDVKALYPDVMGHLQQLAEPARIELGDSARQMTGAGFREPGKVD